MAVSLVSGDDVGGRSPPGMITGRHITTVAAAKTAALISAVAQPRSRTKTTRTTRRIGASHAPPPPLKIAISAALMSASGTRARDDAHSRMAKAAIAAMETTSAAAAISL